jgi:hypothetical protein
MGAVTTDKVRTQIIGAAGEKLVTYKLLKHKIDSARMATDAGVDLVMYIPGHRQAATIQVKAQWEPLPSGGTGALHSAWNFDSDYEVDWLALVDVSADRAWLFTMEQARELAQQKPESGKLRIYWYPDDAVVKGKPRREAEMARYEIDAVVNGIVERRNVEPKG